MKKTAIPIKPGSYQEIIIDQRLSMDEYWFNALIGNQSRYVGQCPVYVEQVGDKKEWLYAKIYSIDADKPKDGDKEKNEKVACTYCFFVYFDRRVWKCRSLAEVPLLIDALQVQDKWVKYATKVAHKKELEKERIAKQKSKLKRIGNRKKAA